MTDTLHSLVDLSPRTQKLYQTLSDFVEYECIPAEDQYHQQHGHGIDRWKVKGQDVIQFDFRFDPLQVDGSTH
ncbi:hypothetical protein O5D80_008574 [Batrachochytrium dendrobatidis]|nr:hypothetical protein O5D80_008574 [Batrachochytrium dendrobatidis]